jgi:soluble lytic murein transglycosylase
VGFVLLLFAVPPGLKGEEPALSSSSPAERLTAVRRLLRDEGSVSPRAAAAGAPLGESETLWSVRLRTARAVLALTAPPTPTIGSAEELPTARLGLPGLAGWIRLMGAKPDVPTLLAWANAEPFEPLARDAGTLAARMARTSGEKGAARALLALWDSRGPRGARSSIDLALARARVAATTAESRRLRQSLAATFPDAPERAADLFDATDLSEFEAAVRSGPEEIRASRALAVASRNPKLAASLVPRAPAGTGTRLDAAEARLVLGDTAEALRLARLALSSKPDGAAVLRARSLELDAEMRSLLRSESAPAVAKRSRRGRAKTPTSPPAPPRAFEEAARRRAEGLLARAGELLGDTLAAADRRRLLADAARVALRSGRDDAARGRIEELLALDPASGAVSDDFFREAFEEYRKGRFAESSVSFERQALLYRDPAIRRRATYWAGRAREKAGAAAEGRAHFATLVTGTSADLYAAWAAASLGVPLPGGPPAPPLVEDLSGLGGDSPAPPSRELLACGLADIAEDAAEAEGSADPLFLAAVSAERGDHRRAVSFLKQRWPALGSPEEGGIPLLVRRLYYPNAHAALLSDLATAFAVPPALVFGLVRQESVFAADIRSRSGAVGLMQLMPATGRQLHHREGHAGRPDLGNPDVNVRLGVAYLRRLLDDFGGDPILALAAYNAGPGRARRWKADLASLPVDEFVESIPFSETRLYVKRVLFFEGAYAALYGIPDRPPDTASRRGAVVP